MISEDGSKIYCDKPECWANFPNHHWGRVKQSEGWFFTQAAKAFCPEHHPEWVAAWREKIKKEKSL